MENDMSKITENNIGKEIRQVRNRYKLSQTELGKLAGITNSAISRIENENRRMPHSLCKALSEIDKDSDIDWMDYWHGKQRAQAKLCITNNKAHTLLSGSLIRAKIPYCEASKRTGFHWNTIARLFYTEMRISPKLALAIEEKIPELGLSANDLLHAQIDSELEQLREEKRLDF